MAAESFPRPSWPRVRLLYSPVRMSLGDDGERTKALEKLRARLVASRLCRDEEDLAQDVIVLVLTKYVTTPTEGLLPLGITIAWKMRAARWRKADRRGENTAVDATDVPLPDVGPDPEEHASMSERKGRLLQAISRLDGKCRELMRLKLEERSFPDIAEILRAKINTVYSWDRRCMGRLRELLGGSWEGRA